MSVNPSGEFQRAHLNDVTKSETPPAKTCHYCVTDVTDDSRARDKDDRYLCLLCLESSILNAGVPFGFRARTVPNLDQGDHTCVKLTYLRKDGTIKNLGHTIMPKPMALEYLWHIQRGPNYSE